jgi:hypothetical protein
MGIYQLQKKQLLPSTIDNVWEFISTPANLIIILQCIDKMILFWIVNEPGNI